MKRKTPKTRRVERDMLGTPSNRAKTWGKRANCPKLNRKSHKQILPGCVISHDRKASMPGGGKPLLPLAGLGIVEELEEGSQNPAKSNRGGQRSKRPSGRLSGSGGKSGAASHRNRNSGRNSGRDAARTNSPRGGKPRSESPTRKFSIMPGFMSKR